MTIAVPLVPIIPEMKAFPTLAGIVLVFLLTSCARFSITSPAQLVKLPVSRGDNGASYVSKTAWKYRGSFMGSQQFYYSYHQDNLLKQCTVSIPRRLVVLHVPEVKYGSEPQQVTLRLDATAFHLYPHIASAPDPSDGF